MSKRKKYDSANQFVADLMDNAGKTFADDYGRKWMYSGFEFYHQDLGDDSFHKGIFCLYLFGTAIKIHGEGGARLQIK